MTEPRDIREKRLAMRSMRRGIKEMDLILDSFARAHLADLSEADLDLYEALLAENDHDLYQWVSGQVDTPAPYGPLIARITKQARGLTRPA